MDRFPRRRPPAPDRPGGDRPASAWTTRPAVSPAPAFEALAEAGLITLGTAGSGPRIILTLSRTKDQPQKRLILPDLTLVD